MGVPIELLAGGLAERIATYFTESDICYEEIIKSRAVQVLQEIEQVFQDGGTEKTDFELVEEIIQIFIKYNLDSGSYHDFG